MTPAVFRRVTARLLACSAAALFFAACAADAAPPAASAAGGAQSAARPAAPASSPTAPAASSSAAEKPPCFFNSLADKAVAALRLTGREEEMEKIRAAYLYVIAGTHYLAFDEPELTETWRYLDTCGERPAIWQVMAVSPLYYGAGSCENYAAALMVILERMGFEVLYVPGLTYSVEGALVDHAWMMVKAGGEWYHLDPQLEDNVTRQGMVQYRYFMKGDEDYAVHHLWGARLQHPDAHSLALPACPASAPAPGPEQVVKSPPTELDALLEQAAAVREAAAGYRCDLQPLTALPPFPSQAAGEAIDG